MPHTFASLLVHVIFSTKNRAPTLSADLASRLFPYMGGIVRERNGQPLIINGPADHVHLLLSIPATESIADLLRVPKTNSSRWVHEQFSGSAGRPDTLPSRSMDREWQTCGTTLRNNKSITAKCRSRKSS